MHIKHRTQKTKARRQTSGNPVASAHNKHGTHTRTHKHLRKCALFPSRVASHRDRVNVQTQTTRQRITGVRTGGGTHTKTTYPSSVESILQVSSVCALSSTSRGDFVCECVSLCVFAFFGEEEVYHTFGSWSRKHLASHPRWPLATSFDNVYR